MHTALHAIGLVGAGFVLASIFLAVTRPPTTTARLCGSTPRGDDSNHASDMPFMTPRPAFWELNEPKTAADAVAGRSYRAQEFQSPAQNVSSPIEPVFFLRQPEKFVQMFKDCEEDIHCYVTYHHVPKTGGTTIEAALSQVFDQKPESSCCNEWLLQVFHKDEAHYCNSKFTSWQMDYPIYFEVLDTCFKRNVNKKRRVLMLISFREPISTTLSFIHQRCNKNFDKRAELVQEACTVCQYEAHRSVWDRFVGRITSQLDGAWHVMHALQDEETDPSKIRDLPLDRLQVALMEPNDIDAFLKAWHPEMEFHKVNEEALNRCYFRMPKEYIDKLAPAAEWYRRFVAGVAG